jgi:hypothetical protein
MSSTDLLANVGDVESFQLVRLYEGKHSSSVPRRHRIEIGREVTMPGTRYSSRLLLAWRESDPNEPESGADRHLCDL